MKINIFFSTIATCIIITISNLCVAGTFTSLSNGGGAWTAGVATWTILADADGIPDSDDDVTILVGDNITWGTTSGNCKSLTINGTMTGSNSGAVIYIHNGDYVVSATGTEAGVGQLGFRGSNKTITAIGSISNAIRWFFFDNTTILSPSVITKNAMNISNTFRPTVVVTNLGTVSLSTIVSFSGATWINGTNSTLTIRAINFMSGAGRTFTANASGNTVILRYSAGAIPITTSGYNNLVIAGTVAGTKTLPANTIVAKNLTINSSNTLNSNNFDLSVGGNWLNNGLFTASAGKTVTFNGTVAQTVSNTLGTTTFKGLAINNTLGVTLTSGTYILNEVLTLSNGTFNTGGRTFTMTSTATQTARIAPVSGTGAIAGNFVIQRFITARDTTYADFSSPVQSSTFADWDNELPAISYNSSPPTAECSAYTYDEAANAYIPVTSPGTSLIAGQGFEVYLSGDFSYGPLPATTMNTIGVPNYGNFDLSTTVSNNVQGWNLVGNPFASSISWASIYTASGGAGSGMYDYIEMYDYTIGDWQGYTSASGIEIGATQGFWVYGLSGPMTLLIPETTKTTSSNSSIKNASIVQPYFNLKLSNTTTNFAHTFKVVTSDIALDGLDNKDIPFRASLNKATPQMYCEIGGKKININNFNSSNDSYSIPLKTKAAVSGSYKIEASGFDFVDYTCIKLQDNLTGKVIDLEGNGYCFTMNSADNADRFILLFSKDDNCKSASVATSPTFDFSNQIEVLPSAQGNVVNFNLSETTKTNISIVNVLGQTIVQTITMDATNESINVTLPEGFSGMYIIKIESSKGTITKKFVKK